MSIFKKVSGVNQTAQSSKLKVQSLMGNEALKLGSSMALELQASWLPSLLALSLQL
jgi:hypothetical protein